MTKHLNILLVCANGASTSILAERMKKSTLPDEEWLIEARSVSELENVIGKYDCVLVAPQIQYQIKEIEEIAEPYETIKVLAINPNDFANGNGEKVDEFVRANMNDEAKDERGDRKSVV